MNLQNNNNNKKEKKIIIKTQATQHFNRSFIIFKLIRLCLKSFVLN